MDWFGKLYCCLSDDNGKTWRLGRQQPFATADAKGGRIMTQEPGVVELKDGRVLMYARTNVGRQWFYYSSDGCETWTKGTPGSLASPLSPATVKRLANGDLLAIWNDHERYPLFRKMGPAHRYGLRSPLMLAVSKDEGRTWVNRRPLEGDLEGCFCYAAACESDGNLLLGYCADSLVLTQVTVVPLAWLYEKQPKKPPYFSGCSPFANLADGPMRELKGPLGVWQAKDGHAAIATWGRGKGLRLLGGRSREVLLTLPSAISSDELVLLAERYTISAPFEFTVEAKTVDGNWEPICPAGNEVPTGRPVELAFRRLERPVVAYRFRCTSAAGVLLGLPGDCACVPDAFFSSRY